LRATSRRTDRVTHLLDDQVDVALRIGNLPDSILVAVGLGAVRRIVCASPNYLPTKSAPSVPEDLVEHDAISFDGITAPSYRSFWNAGEEMKVPIRSRLSVNTIDAAIDAGPSGAGVIRVMSYQVVEHLKRNELVTVLDQFAPSAAPVHLVYDKQGRLPLKLRAFIDFVVPSATYHTATTLCCSHSGGSEGGGWRIAQARMLFEVVCHRKNLAFTQAACSDDVDRNWPAIRKITGRYSDNWKAEFVDFCAGNLIPEIRPGVSVEIRQWLGRTWQEERVYLFVFQNLLVQRHERSLCVGHFPDLGTVLPKVYCGIRKQRVQGSCRPQP